MYRKRPTDVGWYLSLQLGASITKDVTDGPAAAPLVNVPVGVMSLCLLRPEAGALLQAVVRLTKRSTLADE